MRIEKTVPQSELEIEFQKMVFALQQKEKLLAVAHKVAHDLSSPLSALNMMMQVYDELPADKRILIRRTTDRILDIANHLLSTYRQEENLSCSSIESRQCLHISDLINQLVNEKKVQYRKDAVMFETIIENNARHAFICIQKTEFERMMSNLINNAVDALEGKKDGLVTVQLTASADTVVVKVEDNGKGIAHDKVEKMQARQGYTEGKEKGHGLGLQQVWDTLEHNQGVIKVKSELNKGTLIQLSFPRVAVTS
jgi:signal transduction histidine kinase